MATTSAAGASDDEWDAWGDWGGSSSCKTEGEPQGVKDEWIPLGPVSGAACKAPAPPPPPQPTLANLQRRLRALMTASEAADDQESPVRDYFWFPNQEVREWRLKAADVTNPRIRQ